MKKKSDLSSVALAKDEITNLEILQAVNNFSSEMDKRFDGVESRLNKVEFNQEATLSKLDNVAYKSDIRNLENRVGVLESK